MVARRKANRLQHAAAYCNALQHTATHVMVVRRRAHGLKTKAWSPRAGLRRSWTVLQTCLEGRT